MGGFFTRKIVRVLVSRAVAELPHESRGSIAYVHWYGEVSVLRDVLAHFAHRHVNAIVLRCPSEIVRKPTKLEFGFGHSDLFANVVDHVGVRKGLRIGKPHVFGSEIQHPSGDVSGILASGEHSSHVIDCRIAVGIAKRFVHGGDVVVVVVTVPVVRKHFSGALYDVIDTQFAVAFYDERLLEHRQREAKIAVSFLG